MVAAPQGSPLPSSFLISRNDWNEGVTEALKAHNQMTWGERISNIQNRAAEVIFNDLIYNWSPLYIWKRRHRRRRRLLFSRCSGSHKGGSIPSFLGTSSVRLTALWFLADFLIFVWRRNTNAKKNAITAFRGLFLQLVWDSNQTCSLPYRRKNVRWCVGYIWNTA